MLALLAALACAPEPLSASVRAGAGVVEVASSRQGFRVELRSPAGVPLVRASAPEGATTATVAVPPGVRGAATVAVLVGAERVELPVDFGAPGALDAQLALPLGAEPAALRGGERVAVPLLEGATAQAGLRLRAPDAAGVRVVLDGAPLSALAPGEVRLVPFTLAADAELRLEAEGAPPVVTTLDVRPVPLAEARARLRVAGVRFPARADGSTDAVRPPGRVTLPSPWWRHLLDRTPLGVRARDEWAPWAHTAVDLVNDADAPLDVVVRLRVLGADGRPDPAFRPRLRDADDGTGNTSVLVRVPAGGHATATLPLFVDEAALDPADTATWTRVVEVLPVGLPAPLSTDRTPLYVSRSSSVVAAGLALTLATAAAGAGWIVGGLRRWFRTFDTPALVTVALFGALHFVTGTVGLLLGLGAAAAAGPFSTLVTGLVDDALQATLTGALVFLLPRPGAATLGVLVAWLLRGVATGSLSPLDLVYVSCRVATLEASLWAFGLTRGGAWRDEPRPRRVLRLGAGLATSSLAGTAASLVLHAALFRLHYAPWYVAMVLAGPGFLYALAASGLAERVSAQLRRVED